MSAVNRVKSTIADAKITALLPSLTKLDDLLGKKFPVLELYEQDLIREGMEDDAPAVVSIEDIDAAMARSPQQSTPMIAYPDSLRSKYPLLFASMMPHEDIMMTCARALDDQVDVSVVRQAAAYLEEVEANN